MSTFYDYDEDGNVTADWGDEKVITIDEIEEKIMQASSGMLKHLINIASIEDYISDEKLKKRIWLLRNFNMTIRPENIDHIMKDATDDEINQMVVERTMELANG